jgi:two-component system NtrC family sensor kinase
MAKTNLKTQWESRVSYAEKYLRSFVDFCPVPIAMLDCNLRYVLVSQAWVKLLSIPRLKLVGTSIYDSLPIALNHRHALERCLSGGQMRYGAEVELENRDRLLQLYQLQVQPWYSDDGATGGVVLALNPTQNIKSIQQQLALEIAEREHFEDAFHKVGTALESANDAVCITDEQGRPIYTNLAFNELFAYDLIDLQYSSQFPQLFASEAIAQAIHNAVMHGGNWSSELDMFDRDRQAIPIYLRVNPVKNHSGTVVGSTYVCTSIRDRKAAEAEINKSFAALGATLEATADGILVLDAIGNIIICNQKFVDLLRIPKRIFSSHDDSHILKYVAKRVKSADYLHTFGKGLEDDQNSFEVVELDDGRTLECYSQPQHIFDACAGRVWSLRDITERLASEALVRASEEKYRLQAEMLELALQELKSTQSQLIQAEKMSGLGQLVAGIAHEINNPVNFIYGNLSYADSYTKELLGLVEMYRQTYAEPTEAIAEKLTEMDIDFLTQDFVKLVSSIRLGAERIQKIVQSLNKFSRSDEEGCKFVDIQEGIDSTLLILQSRIKASSLRPEIIVEKHYGDLPQVECYAGQLNQVFMNLLSNAIDALDEDAQEHGSWQIISDRPQWVRPDGKVSRIVIKTELVGGDRLLIKISDNGQGVPDNIRNRLFDLFFTTKPVGKGTGLGLSISYQIVTEIHHGRLSFNSELTKGTEFIIDIPLVQPKVSD